MGPQTIVRPAGMCALRVFILLCTATCATGAPQYIRVGTFNIARLGASDEYMRSLPGLANAVIEGDFDLLCLQEIEPNELGWAQVSRLRELLNIAAEHYKTRPYESRVAPEATGGETTAFLWRAPVVLQSPVMLLPHDVDPDGDGLRTFQRTPTIAFFRAKNYDFYVVNCHLYTLLKGKTSEGRGAEYDALYAWLVWLAAQKEKDAIVLGDFNRFLNGKKDWYRMMRKNCEHIVRFPLLEAIEAENPRFDPETDDAPADLYSTTTNKKGSIYDQILLSAGSYREFVRVPRFGLDVGIVAFDNDKRYEWFINDWHHATKILSDHRPVWIRLRIDQRDDD
jgi:endonuclease/exonuclease/phosphatase family metal-dependent hydrolase